MLVVSVALNIYFYYASDAKLAGGGIMYAICCKDVVVPTYIFIMLSELRPAGLIVLYSI